MYCWNLFVIQYMIGGLMTFRGIFLSTANISKNFSFSDKIGGKSKRQSHIGSDFNDKFNGTFSFIDNDLSNA